MARTEYRAEVCDDCNGQREREWLVQTVHKGAPVPRGYRVEKRTGEWRTVAARTRFTTLCECDAP